MEERIIYQASNKDCSLRQGEILTGVVQYKPVADELLQQTQELSFEAVLHPYVIVVTQDCDLDWDYKNRNSQDIQLSKSLNSIILCEIGTAQEIRDTADNMNTKEWGLVKNHRHERFYFFEKIPAENEIEKEGLPELTADFKRVFGMDSNTLYHQIEIGMIKRRTVLVSPYLEHFSRRYYCFHGRVALPSQYESEREG
jgi:hypothetical protein